MELKIINKIGDEYLYRLNILKSMEEYKWGSLAVKLMNMINSELKKKKAKGLTDIYVSGKGLISSEYPPFVTFTFDNGDWITFDMFSAIDCSQKKVNLDTCSILYYSHLFEDNEAYNKELFSVIKQNNIQN